MNNKITKEEFLVLWNPETYGEQEPKFVSFKEFKDDGIRGDWNIDEEGEFTLDELIYLPLGETLTVCDPFGWSIKVVKVKSLSLKEVA